MKKFFFNNQNAAIDNGVVAILMFFVISLVFSATYISWILLQMYGVSVSGIALSATIGGVSDSFTTNSLTTDIVYVGDEWNYQSNVGRVATNVPSYLLIPDVASNNDGSYSNTYYINNSVHGEYAIVLEYHNNGVLEIDVTEEGFYYDFKPTGWVLYDREPDFYPFNNATNYDNVEIKTMFNPTVETGKTGLEVYFNGVNVITKSSYDLWGSGSGGLSTYYYGGIGAFNSGITIQEFQSSNDRTGDDWSNLATQAITFVSTFAKIIVWNVDSMYLPWEINLIFIKTQMFAVVACFAVYARG